MSDEEVVFESEDEPEVEFVDEAAAPAEDEEKDLPEDVKKTSKKDLYARLKAAEEKVSSAPDPTDRITKAVEGAFGRIVAPTPAAQPQPGESESAFRERLKKDLFDEDKAEGILNELVDRRLGPRLAQTLDLSFKQAEKIMELDPETGPIYRRYRGEIGEYIKKNFPAELQRNPQALEFAYKQVMVNHIQEISEEKAQRILEEEKKKAAPARREPVALESGSSGGSSAPKKRVIAITQEDRRIADEMGVDASTVAARRAGRMS